MGMPAGSARSRPASAMASINCSADARASSVKRRVSLALSHTGWCLLKSPNQMMCLRFALGVATTMSCAVVSAFREVSLFPSL